MRRPSRARTTSPGLILIPAAAAVLTVPIVASGGIADARGLVAALALGADAVNMGTRFMCTAESPIHERIKAQIVANDERSTNLIFRRFRNTARVVEELRQSTRCSRSRRAAAQFDDVRELVSGARGSKVYETGDPEHGIWWAGHGPGADRRRPAGRRPRVAHGRSRRSRSSPAGSPACARQAVAQALIAAISPTRAREIGPSGDGRADPRVGR